MNPYPFMLLYGNEGIVLFPEWVINQLEVSTAVCNKLDQQTMSKSMSADV